MDRKAIVIGATGVVGREIIKLLGEDENYSEVVTFTRRVVDFDNPKILNYVIDFSEIEKYADLIEGEYLFSALGTTKAQAGSIEEQRIVDVDYQFQFAKIAAQNGVHHYHLVSSPGADADSSNDYLQMKGVLEDKTRALDFASHTFYKPSLIDGERKDKRVAEKIGIALVAPLKFIPGLSKYQKITGLEIAKKMVFEASRRERGKKEYVLDELFDLSDS